MSVMLNPKGNNSHAALVIGRKGLVKTPLHNFIKVLCSWIMGSWEWPYVVTANKHVDFHTRVVRLREDF